MQAPAPGSAQSGAAAADAAQGAACGGQPQALAAPDAGPLAHLVLPGYRAWIAAGRPALQAVSGLLLRGWRGGCVARGPFPPCCKPPS